MTTEKTATATRPGSWDQQRFQLKVLVSRRVNALQKLYCPDQAPSAKAALAQLRRAAGDDGTMRGLGPDAFAVDAHTHVPEDLYPRNINDDERTFGDAPTQAEIAVRSAMTLYAIHQQSRGEGMHGESRPGVALGRLNWTESVSEDALRRRFAALITAETYAELSHHLRTMVRMLRDHSIPMDYGQLTADLFTWQARNGSNGIRLRWSRDFENSITPSKPKNETTGEENS